MPRPLVPNRRERILDAAEALVLERGFDAMSVASVATHAGIGKGAVYLEFGSKRDILDALLRRGTERMQARVAAEVGDRPPLSEAYRAGLRTLLDDRLMTAAFLDDQGVIGGHVDTVTDGRYRARHVGVVEWLRDLRDRGELVEDVDPEHLALALSSVTIGLLSAAKLLGPVTPAQLEGAVETLTRMVESLERTPT
ncbi:TetR family transcriptional regulator [Kribbella amoyensis]|uniref:TetR family transcriptional regulator n=1 Tax=Kribbella amoyensis TaxID=996641 RepID=A0A561BQC6_9ACTN|nr:TetR/AcrR family transcriptional regulator [Kribbella amoyensis]TWD81071.1 TetR family transcriptional regulator [Kribbella amoyensis]